ncbi:hypothetical protein IDZ49_11760, partial [Francisella tularensis]|uniref:TUL4 family lipoprotein n=1 Tax=Francisella tularensis TaxID=263 RepID=UPI0016806912
MKKILIFSQITSALAGCNKYNAFIDKILDSDNSIKVNPDDNLDNPDQDGKVVSEDNPTATLKLKYKATTHEIDARIITNWNVAPQGKIYLNWVAHKDTNCYSKSFPIIKFNETKEYTLFLYTT